MNSEIKEVDVEHSDLHVRREGTQTHSSAMRYEIKCHYHLKIRFLVPQFLFLKAAKFESKG